MEVVVNGSGDIFCCSHSATARVNAPEIILKLSLETLQSSNPSFIDQNPRGNVRKNIHL